MSYTELSKPIAQPKKRLALLTRRERKAGLDYIDRQERAKCHKRSGGWCEVWILDHYGDARRCQNRYARENHHLIGAGMRNRGRSILSEHRLDTCKFCHGDITGHVLQPIGKGRYDAATVVFERVR